MSGKTIVLDANILIRAVLGTRVREHIFNNAGAVNFFAPDVAYDDARKHLPGLLTKRGIDAGVAMLLLDRLENVVKIIEVEVYREMQKQALQRIAIRDEDDWPVLACAMILNCPVWTEDTDFFGTGVATWNTDRISLYFP